MHMVHQRAGGGGGGGGSAGRDDRCAALADRLAERPLQPGVILDHFHDGFSRDRRQAEGREHRGTMVAENENVLHVGALDSGLFGELCPGAVLVEADHRREPVGREAAGLAGRDHAVRVRRVTDYRDAGVIRSNFVDDLALRGENFPVVLEEVGALHAGSARLRADEQAPVGTAEPDFRVVGEHDPLQQRKRAVVELHGHPLEGLHHFFHRHFQEMEDHRLVGTEHRAGGDAGKKGVSNLAGGAGHGNFDG